MIPHPIRLRRPWDELPGATAGHIVYRRRFNCPTGLDTWEHVILEIDRAMYCGEVVLNGQPVGQLETGQFFSADITSLLQPANELQVEVDPQTAAAVPPASNSVYIVDPDEPPGSPVGDVRLVIRTPG